MGNGVNVILAGQLPQAHHLDAAQVLLTTDDVMRRDHYTNVRAALTRLLGLGVVPILNENDAVTTRELRFGDNDRLAALIAQMIKADALVLLTDVDGLYKDFSDKDSLISNLTLDEVNEMLYGGEVDKGMIPKLRAAVDALTGGVFRAHIINGTTPHSLLLELLTDAGVGTVIHSTETAYEFDTHPHPLSTFAARLTENLDEVEKLQTV